MNPKDIFAKALDQAMVTLEHMELELENATPCTDWNLRTLFNHMIYELMWVPELLHGKTVAEVGDKYEHDLIGSDPKTAWHHAADSALLSVNHADDNAVVHVSHGDIPAKDYIEEVGRDIFIHLWDVGQAMYCTILLQPEVAQAIYDHDIARKDELSKGGDFAEAVEVPEDARFQTKFLALYGRREPSPFPAS